MTASLSFFRRDLPVGPPGTTAVRVGPGYFPFHLRGKDGARIPVQLLGIQRTIERTDAPHHYPDQDEVDRAWVAFDAPTMRAEEVAEFAIAPGALPLRGRGLKVERDSLSNRFISLKVTRSGRLTVHDVSSGEEYRDLLRLEDEVDAGDSYTVEVPPRSRRVETVTVTSTRAIASGPLVAALEVRWRMRSAGRGGISGTTWLTLHADSPALHVRMTIDNQATGHRLRARFPVDAGEMAHAGTAFGTAERPAMAFDGREFPAEHPVRTAPAHEFVSAGDAHRGVTIRAPGFFEYEWTARQDLVLTLIRSVGALSRGDLATRPGHAAWDAPAESAQELGLHPFEFTLAFAPTDS